MFRVSKQLLRRYEPQQSWLTHDSHIHGVDHMARVFIFQELICDALEADGVKVNRTATRYAAMAHDVGRIDDGRDPEHGVRSAAWMKENLADKMTPEDLDSATYTVHWHVPPDSKAPVMTTELQVLKDADGLDRVRIGDLNPNYLRTEAARNLIDMAQRLYEACESIDGRCGFESVLIAATDLGIVTDT